MNLNAWTVPFVISLSISFLNPAHAPLLDELEAGMSGKLRRIRAKKSAVFRILWVEKGKVISLPNPHKKRSLLKRTHINHGSFMHLSAFRGSERLEKINSNEKQSHDRSSASNRMNQWVFVGSVLNGFSIETITWHLANPMMAWLWN